MSSPTTTTTTTDAPAPTGGDDHRPHRRARSVRIAATALAAAVAACVAVQFTSSTGAPTAAAGTAAEHGHGAEHELSSRDRATVMLATAGFQDVQTAEAAGYGSSIDTLGCFQDPTRGGMGVHYIDQDLLDATLDPTRPEALVYELGPDGAPIGLVAHEYIVPVDAWTSRRPPRLFGMDLHRHPALPLWVLHTWLWKDNPRGVFDDWNPAVRLCPAGVPIFGVDLPAPATGS